MKTEHRLGWVPTVLVVLSIVFTGSGESKLSSTTPAGSVSNKLAAITRAGQPLTPKELDGWYVAPPDADNAALPYATAFAALTKDDPKTPVFLAQNQTALQLLLQAAPRKSCRYPVDLSAGFSTLLPHLPNMRKCAALLEAEAVAQARQARTDLASQTVLADLRLSRSLENEPVLISQLVRIRIERSALGAMEQALTLKPFKADQLLSLQTALRDAGGLRPFTRGLMGDRCSTIAMFQSPPEEMVKLLLGTNAAFADYQKTTTWQEDFSFALDFFASLLVAAEKPFPDVFAAVADTDKRLQDAKARGLRVSPVALPALAVGFTRAGDAAAHLRAAQTALAIERYRLAHGDAPPASLEALVPAFLEAVPTDPFDGKPLRFEKLAGGGYIVYSVGKDLQDDHGVSAPAGTKVGAPADIPFAVRR